MGQARKGLFFALVGPGGAGKTTLLKEGLKQIRDLKQLATATTRQPRTGETHGIERYFMSNEEFKLKIQANEFYEYEEVHRGTFYGTPRSDIDLALLSGSDLIADIDAKGAFYLKIALPESLLTIFIAPPDISTLRKRLEVRGDDQSANQARIRRFAWEMSFAKFCDEIIVNNSLVGSIASLKGIVDKARSKRLELKTINAFVSLIPILDDTVYLCGDDINPLVTKLRESELPQSALMRIFSDQLMLPCDSNRLGPGQIIAPGFIPILNVETISNALHFQYLYLMKSGEELPSGCHSFPIDLAPISNELRNAIEVRNSGVIPQIKDRLS